MFIDGDEEAAVPGGVPPAGGDVGAAQPDKSIPELAQELGVSGQSLRNWLKQDDLDRGVRSDGLTTAEREELSQLRRDNKRLAEEREILKKAAAFFAAENGTR
jgi:transposase